MARQQSASQHARRSSDSSRKLPASQLVWPCSWSFCKKRFATEIERDNHQNCHSKEMLFRCGVSGCGVTAPHRQALELHKLRDHANSSPPGRLASSSSSQSSARHPSSTSSSSRPSAFPCPGCPADLKSLNGMLKHLSKHHAVETTHEMYVKWLDLPHSHRLLFTPFLHLQRSSSSSAGRAELPFVGPYPTAPQSQAISLGYAMPSTAVSTTSYPNHSGPCGVLPPFPQRLAPSFMPANADVPSRHVTGSSTMVDPPDSSAYDRSSSPAQPQHWPSSQSTDKSAPFEPEPEADYDTSFDSSFDTSFDSELTDMTEGSSASDLTNLLDAPDSPKILEMSMVLDIDDDDDEVVDPEVLTSFDRSMDRVWQDEVGAGDEMPYTEEELRMTTLALSGLAKMRYCQPVPVNEGAR